MKDVKTNGLQDETRHARRTGLSHKSKNDNRLKQHFFFYYTTC